MIYIMLAVLLYFFWPHILDFILLFVPEKKEETDSWRPYAGLDYEPPKNERPKLRRIK